MLQINTNVPSLNAQRNLVTTQGALATALQRLSSGLRINSAADDAAGLAISDRMTTQINGLNQAGRNANDAISLAQTADSALSTVSDNLQRIRELAVQSANATNSSSDRAALDQEVQQRIAEIDRISSQTSFNGQKILDGTFGNAQFQVGANVGDTISIGLNTSMRSTAIGQIAQATGTAVSNTVWGSGGLTIAVGTTATPVSVGIPVAGSATLGRHNYSAYAKAQAINSAGVSGLTATAQNSVTEGTAATAVTLGTGGGQSYALDINGTNVYTNTTASAVISVDTIVAQINLYSGTTGVTASKDSGTGMVTLSTADGGDITVKQVIANGATTNTTGTGLDSTVASAGGLETRGTITLSASDNITLVGGTTYLGMSSNTISKDTTTLSSVNVTSVTNANDAIKRVDSALTSVSSLRSTFGAIQNRFQSTISNLSAVSQNLSAARSRIMDADFAAETANLTRAQILQQAGTAMLAQANSLPQGVLALLK